MSTLNDSRQPVVMLGAGGHAKVLLALSQACGQPVAGVCDPQLSKAGAAVWRGIPVLGGDEALDGIDPQAFGLINGIGQLPKQSTRQRLYESCREKGFAFPSLVHPYAWVAEDVTLSDGVQVMAGVVIQPACVIGMNTIINTRASVDHDCRIGSHVHIAPGAVLCGSVGIDDGVYIGAGATIIQGISIGRGAIAGAGVVCVRNVNSTELIIGASTRRIPSVKK